jgi:hypothetical protein
MRGKSYALRNQRGQIQKSVQNTGNSGFLKKALLLKFKLKPMRSGLWFRALPMIDRVLVDLTTKVAGNARSFARTIHLD